jgi:hypothetical protein
LFNGASGGLFILSLNVRRRGKLKCIGNFILRSHLHIRAIADKPVLRFAVNTCMPLLRALYQPMYSAMSAPCLADTVVCAEQTSFIFDFSARAFSFNKHIVAPWHPLSSIHAQFRAALQYRSVQTPAAETSIYL